jgi:hypothetical protein
MLIIALNQSLNEPLTQRTSSVDGHTARDFDALSIDPAIIVGNQ